MKAFHGKQEVKDFYVARLQEHHRLDQIIQGIGWNKDRGCNVGCILHEYTHAKYPEVLGLPEWYARLCDVIFEGLPKENAPDFAMSSLMAIGVGVDIENVKWQLAILRHEKQLQALEDNKESYADMVRASLQGVINYCKLMLSPHDEKSTESAWSASRSAESARSAAWSVADSAAWSAESARSAAWSVADSVKSAAESARLAAADLARSAYYEWEAETLIQLLKECDSHNLQFKHSK